MEMNTEPETEAVRLQKYLASAGVASRRSAEDLIREGKVAVEGRTVTEPGTKVVPGRERVTVGGAEIAAADKVYFLLNKPRGCLSSLRDRFNRPLVRDFFPPELGRIFPVGRLDFDTEGLLLMTNDGEFCQKLIHPRYGVWKTYLADLRDPISSGQVARLKRGVELEEDGLTAPARVRVVSPDRRRIEISIREGKKRQVRRMAAALGNRVRALKRIKMGVLSLGGLEPGQWRRLAPGEIASLLKTANEDGKVAKKHLRGNRGGKSA